MSGERPRGTVDVVIAGSGGAGICAAIEAKDAGATVAVVERSSELGGATIVSGGGCCLVDTPLQRAMGIQDSPALCLQDWLSMGGSDVDLEWAKFYIDLSCSEVYEWCVRQGVRWTALQPQEGNSVPRWHRPEDGGRELWTTLYEAARRRKVDYWLTHTAVSDIVVEGGRAAGVQVRDLETDEDYTIAAKTVLMATGGFLSNREMIWEYRPDLRHLNLLEGSGVGSTGEGHKIVECHGGFLTHMGNVWMYVYATLDPKDPQKKRGLVFRGVGDCIWINAQGKRFHNENLTGGASGTPAVLAQTPPCAWALIDGEIVKGIEIADPYYRVGRTQNEERVSELLTTSPFIQRANTIEDLAEEMGVPVESLVETVQRYNAAIEQGLEKDPDWGRPLKGRRKLDVAPFYAIQMFPMARKALGGVRTNLHCQVLDSQSKVIPGLYAAGEIAGMAGGHINGKAALEGTMLGPVLFSGRVAGAWAAQESGHGRGFAGEAYWVQATAVGR